MIPLAFCPEKTQNFLILPFRTGRPTQVLVSQVEKYERVAFADEAEIEKVVQMYAEELFGSNILYLPKARIGGVASRAMLPDAVVIDVDKDEWYLVEAERAMHGTWEQIAPAVSKHLAGVALPGTINNIVEAALAQLRGSSELRTAFQDAGVSEHEVQGRLQSILAKPPIIAIPIDSMARDLSGWAQTLRNDVNIWIIEKFVSNVDATRILYSLPDDSVPTISTASERRGTLSELRTTGTQPYQELLNAMPELIGKTVKLEYGPRGGKRRTFEGVLRTAGVEFEGEVRPISSAAVHCLKKAGSSRKTANGWTMWRTSNGEYLMDLYRKLGTPVRLEEPLAAAAVAVGQA
jgi:hypothetical protein